MEKAQEGVQCGPRQGEGHLVGCLPVHQSLLHALW